MRLLWERRGDCAAELSSAASAGTALDAGARLGAISSGVHALAIGVLAVLRVFAFPHFESSSGLGGWPLAALLTSLAGLLLHNAIEFHLATAPSSVSASAPSSTQARQLLRTLLTITHLLATLALSTALYLFAISVPVASSRAASLLLFASLGFSLTTLASTAAFRAKPFASPLAIAVALATLAACAALVAAAVAATSASSTFFASNGGEDRAAVQACAEQVGRGAGRALSLSVVLMAAASTAQAVVEDSLRVVVEQLKAGIAGLAERGREEEAVESARSRPKRRKSRRRRRAERTGSESDDSGF